MDARDNAWVRHAPEVRSVLRIVAGFLFLLSGTPKLFGFPTTMPDGGTAAFGTLPWFAGFLEVVGGGLLMLGLFTRPVAFIVSGEMAVAYFMAHAPQGFWPTVNHGDKAALYCFVWLYFSAAGAGPWSLDAKLRGRP